MQNPKGNILQLYQHRDMKRQKAYHFGILAEKIVIWFLRLKGYKILHWRYKTYFGEIDIIAKKGKTVIFIEVKARKYQKAIEEIFGEKQALRVKKAAQMFIDKSPNLHDFSYRFDLILLDKFLLPKHLLNFW